MAQSITINLKNAFCRLVPVLTVRTEKTCSRCLNRRYLHAGHLSPRRKYLLKLKQFYTSQRLRCASSVKEDELPKLFPLRFSFLRTSVAFWEEYPNGVQFDVGYIDTKLRADISISDNKPVILGLPSSSGSHLELTGILLTFAKLGYRVVIPNLPGSSFCRGKGKDDEAIFQMSVKEKAEFVTDFLRYLKIQKVDMLVTNSCSVYTGVELCVFQPSLFGSLVMINPTGVHPTKSMLPVRLHQIFTKVYDDRFILQGILKAIAHFVKKFTKKSHWETTNFVVYTRTIAALSFEDEKVRAEYMRNRAVPCYAIFGADNDFLDVNSTKEYLSALGIPESAIEEIDTEGKIVKKGEPCNGNYGLHVPGSYDIKETRTVLIRKELLKIMKKIQPHL